MFDLVLSTGIVECVDTIEIACLFQVDFLWRILPASWGCEMRAVVGKNGVNFIGNGFDQSPQKVGGNAPSGAFLQWGKGKLGSPVHGDESIGLAFCGANLGDVDMEVADRI